MRMEPFLNVHFDGFVVVSVGSPAGVDDMWVSYYLGDKYTAKEIYVASCAVCRCTINGCLFIRPVSWAKSRRKKAQAADAFRRDVLQRLQEPQNTEGSA